MFDQNSKTQFPKFPENGKFKRNCYFDSRKSSKNRKKEIILYQGKVRQGIKREEHRSVWKEWELGKELGRKDKFMEKEREGVSKEMEVQ